MDNKQSIVQGCQLTANVHSTESFGSLDGPGVRFIVFLKGCPLRCAYCHNPDTWATREGEQWTVEQVLERAERYRAYWGGDGGITVSGGEPMLQAEFVAELFEEAHRRGINTCMDTSAAPYDGSELQHRLLRATDTVLLDIKHIDPKVHKRLTGRSNENILECARWMSDAGTRVWIRHVLVPGWTDDEPSLRRLSDFLHTLTNIERVEVLPYHTMGRFKWDKLSLHYRLDGVEPPTAEAVKRAREILSHSSVT